MQGAASYAIPLRDQERSGSAWACHEARKKGGERDLSGGDWGWSSGTGLAAFCPYAATSCGNLWGIVTAVPSGGKIAAIRAVLRAGGELRVMPGTAVKRRRRRCGGRENCVDKLLVRWRVRTAQTFAAGYREDAKRDTF